MGFTDTLKAAMDTTRKYQLSRTMTIDEVYQLLVSAGLDPADVGSFELKKGLGGKSIVFSGGTIAYPTLTVHGSEARLQKIIKQKGKGQFTMELTGHVSINAQTVVPMEFYSIEG